MRVRVYDNDGATFDRYTVIIDGDVYTMSHKADRPDGVNQYAGRVKDLSISGESVSEKDWPEGLRRAISERRLKQ